jgi:hypothetical protein
MIDNESLEPMTINSTIPLCMDQYRQARAGGRAGE